MNEFYFIKINLILLLSVFLIQISICQDNTHTDGDTTIYRLIDIPVYFPGCDSLLDNTEDKKTCSTRKLLEFVYSNFKYPELARENGMQGMVVVNFIVEKDGSLSNPSIVQNLGGGCGDEAIRIVKLMPDWIPAVKNGEVVRSQYANAF